MSPAPRRRGNQRRPAAPRRPANLWRVPPPLPAVEPIVVASDVGALLRSLGDPPMNRSVVAGHYFNSVVERAAAVAVALALSADLLGGTD